MRKFLFKSFLMLFLILPSITFALDTSLGNDEAGVIFLNDDMYNNGGNFKGVISYISNKDMKYIGTLHANQALFHKMKAGQYDFLSYSSSNNGSVLSVKLEKKKYYYFVAARYTNGDKGFVLLKSEKDFKTYADICKKAEFYTPTKKELIRNTKESKQERMFDLYSSIKKLGFDIKVPNNYGVGDWKCK